jgi:CheY-like chemotaxis protein
VSTIIVASDTAAVRREVVSVLDAGSHDIIEAASGPEVLELVHEEEQVDLVIADIQMATMGAIALCLELRLQASYDAIDPIPFLMLLDRRPDVFQAKRAGADGFVIKPLDAIRLRRASAALLAGERYEDRSFQPVTVLSGEAG